jgi:hypothetical protein
MHQLQALRQFRGKTPAQIQSILRRRAERLSPTAVVDLAQNLPRKLRAPYRREVERILAEVAKEVSVDVARPRVEVFVAVEFLARMQIALAMQQQALMGERDAKALDTLIARLWAMTEHLEVLTPRGRRLGKRTSTQDEASAVAASEAAIARVRTTAADADSRYSRLPTDQGEQG